MGGELHLQTVLDELVLSEAVDSSFRRLPTLSFLPRTISGHLGGPRVQRFTLPSRRELLGDTGSLLDSTQTANLASKAHGSSIASATVCSKAHGSSIASTTVRMT